MLKEIEFTDIRANLIIDLIKEQGFIIKDIDTKKTKICEFMNILIDCLENVKKKSNKSLRFGFRIYRLPFSRRYNREHN